MNQEDSLFSEPLHKTFLLQSSNDTLALFNDETGFLFTSSQKDSLYKYTQPPAYSSDTINQSLSRFFIEKGETQIKEVKRSEYQPIPLWIHLSLFFWVIVVLFVRQTYTIRLRQIIVATINPKQVKQLLREANLLKHGFSLLLLLLFAFTLSVFAYFAINIQYPNSFYFSLSEGFLLLFGFVVLFHFGKFLSIWFLGILFETRLTTIRYLIDHYVFYISESLLLFPILILFVYSGLQLFMYVAIIVLLILWVYRIQRAIGIGLECTNFSRSYLFLYLCTLEVVPFFMLYKLSLQFV